MGAGRSVAFVCLAFVLGGRISLGHYRQFALASICDPYFSCVRMHGIGIGAMFAEEMRGSRNQRGRSVFASVADRNAYDSRRSRTVRHAPDVTSVRWPESELLR